MNRSATPGSAGPWVKSPFGSIGLSLFLWLSAVIVAAFAVYAWVAIRTASSQWNESVLLGARQFSDLIRRSTHYAMLLNRKEDVRQIVRTVSGEPGVVGVRIYDKSGRIVFSADDADVGAQVDLQAEACVICHDRSEPLRSVPSQNRVRVYESPSGERVLGLIDPIVNLPECTNSGCHAHPPDQTILGVLDVKMGLGEADFRLAVAKRQVLAAGAATALAAGLASALFILLVVRRPVRRLIAGAGRVASGDLAVEIPEDRVDEMGELARAFNRMTRDLRSARAELQAWSDRLETRLVERTEELNRTQRQVVHMERMASLGKLSATVAHELNNPLAGILNYAKLVERTLDESAAPPAEAEELRRYLGLIHKEAGRCGDIVRNLLLFARRTGAELAYVPLNPIVERALMLVRHHLEIAGVKLEITPIDGDDRLVCDPNQIQQALVAILVNAAEAMPNGGSLSIAAEGRSDEVEIAIADSGVGIPPEVLPHIFEPFFSTKDDVNGVGLGLAVVYGILQRHGGTIAVDSSPGSGTTFHIRLPRRPAAAESQESSDGRLESRIPTGRHGAV